MSLDPSRNSGIRFAEGNALLSVLHSSVDGREGRGEVTTVREWAALRPRAVPGATLGSLCKIVSRPLFESRVPPR